ncbi:hypothetical protein ACIO13_24700 [Streptomyces sp. NPDC087425]|uniref:hypothetical protein n=1 Tax=Streptomyces sp. NPDC087425 TaxID=3365787 RepID=UPI0038121760
MSAAEAAPDGDVLDDDQDADERPLLEIVETEEPSQVASFLADLRPYLPTRSQLRSTVAGVGAGSRVLAGRGWAWVSAEGWIWDGVIRAGAVVGGTWVGAPVLWRVVADATGVGAPYIPTVALVCGCAVVRQFAPDQATRRKDKRAKKAKQAEKAEKTKLAKAERPRTMEAENAPAVPTEVEIKVEVEDQDQDDEVDVDDIAQLVRDVAARHGHQGAHLDDLLDAPLLVGWEKTELKALLTDEFGLPVGSFKLHFPSPQGRRQRVRDGVRLRDLPPVGEGPGQSLSLVPRQPPSQGSTSTPPEGPVGTRSEPAAGAADSPSPDPAQSLSQRRG